MRTLCDNVPSEMRNLPRWVGRDEEAAASLGLNAKTPLSVFSKCPASVSNPNTWGTFSDARRCVEEGIYQNIGFVFADDGLVGIDIDKDAALDSCRLPTNDAYEAIKACASYTELSQSGKGFHIICKGDLPFTGANNGKGWEIYKAKRYFVMTGRTVIYDKIVDAQDAIQMILERHFKDTPKQSTGSSKAKLWKPICEVSEGGKVTMTYPKVSQGSRHLMLVSYCGQINQAEPSKQVLLNCALKANQLYFDPPLDEEEVKQIVKSIRGRQGG